MYQGIIMSATWICTPMADKETGGSGIGVDVLTGASQLQFDILK